MKDNTFTVGNVEIELEEEFGDGDGVEALIPATGSPQDGTLQNAVVKKVFVKNTGSEDAYVRVHIAIPALLDGEDAGFTGNMLHFLYSDGSFGDGKWDWTDAAGAPYEGADWNRYTATIGGNSYHVYVVTYGSAMKTGETTVDAIHQVYLDPAATNEDIDRVKKTLGDQWHIYVVAEGAQIEGFQDAYEALNTAFGVPGSYTVDW